MSKVGRILEQALARAKATDHVFMVVVAVIIGCLGGLGATAFRYLIQFVQRLSWGGWDYSLELVREHPWWFVALVPALGGLIVGPLVYFLAREAKGHGVPEVMESVALRSGVIRPRVVLVKSLASAITIGTGGSVGREGPIVQIGSAIGSSIGQLLRMSGRRLRTLVGCGAAAGIAATFNAPVAGALFAVEVILGDFGVSQFSPIVISSVMATVVSRHFLDDVLAFEVPEYVLQSVWELPGYLVLGLLAGLVALLFIKVLYGFEDLFEKIPLRPWLLAPLGGLMVGLIGVRFPEILGVGYEAIEQALHGRLALQLLVVLVLVKLLSTSITIGSGGSGGVFAPSLFLGAMTGGLVGVLMTRWFPEISGGAGAYALVGMGAVVAGATHAPITAILIIFEMTSDYKLILPLMAACVIATLVTTRVQPESIYTKKLLRRGVDIFRGREINVLRSLRVSEVMDPDVPRVRYEEPLGRVLERVNESPYVYFYVVGPDEKLTGVLALPELRDAVLDADVLSNLLVAGELARESYTAVLPDQDLDTVMRLLAGKSREELPVIDSRETRRLVGVITRRHLIDAYNRELLKRDMVAGVGSGLAAATTEEVHLGRDYRMAEIDAPGQFVDRTIRELDVRARYGAQVLLLRRPWPEGGEELTEVVPGPDTVVRRGDRLLVMGLARDIDRLRAL
jgi:CIC family chloride channel protein